MKLDVSRAYHVDGRYLAHIIQLEDDSYEVTYLGLTFKIQSANEAVCGERAVFCVGEKKTKKKLVVMPSPVIKEV